MKINMKIISGYPNGACSYYRSNGVFPKIENINTAMIADVNWQSLSDTHIVVMERPSDINYYNAANMIKDFGVKLWVDFDDNFFCLPKWNQAKAHYDNDQNKGAIIKSLQLADVVTVTTQNLKNAYMKYNDNIKVIPNAFNDYNFKFEKKTDQKKIIMWRGSATHQGDLYAEHTWSDELMEYIIETNKDILKQYEAGKITAYEFSKKILESSNDARISGYAKNVWKVSEKYKNWKWHFIGSQLEKLTDAINNKKVQQELHIVNYFIQIKKINPAIYIALLAFNEFNKCKSNCGWIEATYAGAATVAPDMDEFKKPGILTYQNPDEYQDKLEQLINNEDLRNKCYTESYDYIKENLLLSKVNKEREKIIKEIM